MGMSIHKIKKWTLMLMGKSILHVNQDVGKFFSAGSVKGYYNNMTEKVIKQPDLLLTDELPTLKFDDGKDVVFPVAIFQYGLGAYDLYIETKDEKYLNKFRQCADWAVSNIETSGGWKNFSHLYPDAPYGAMAQGEGISLLMRAYREFNEDEYLKVGKKALEFMLKPVDAGGTTLYDGEDVLLMEYTVRECVLNGWIFALWGIYDFLLTENDDKVRKIYDNTLRSLEKYLKKFSLSYWSLYELDGKIASPFYHKLHIAQLEAMYKITEDEIFKNYGEKWKEYLNSPIKKARAFIKKAWQKVVER